MGYYDPSPKNRPQTVKTTENEKQLRFYLEYLGFGVRVRVRARARVRVEELEGRISQT